MFKYIFISLFLHLTVLAVIYGSVRMFSFNEKGYDYRSINIRGIEFYSLNRKAKTGKTVKKDVKKVVKSKRKRSPSAKNLNSRVKEKEVAVEGKITERQSELSSEVGEFRKVKQKDKEVFPKIHKDIISEADMNKNGKVEEKEDYSLIYTKQNLEIIRKIIADSIEYPIVARKMGWEGTVVIAFTLSKGGDLLGVEIIKSSGYSLLDEYTVSVIKEVYKRFPLPESDVRIKIPVSYHLE